MARSSIAVLDTKRLGAIFGPRDQNLRRIRSALGVGIAARGDSIHIDGEEHAVLRATEIFEELDRIARDHGGVAGEEVERLLPPISLGQRGVERFNGERRGVGCTAPRGVERRCGAVCDRHAEGVCIDPLDPCKGIYCAGYGTCAIDFDTNINRCRDPRVIPL